MELKNLNEFKFWCQKVLPLVYDESLSYYEVLCKVVDYINKIIENQNKINEMISPYASDFEKLKEEVDFVKLELEKVKNGDYVSLYIDSLSKWIDNNLQTLVAKIVKYVSFGLTQDGYFTALIPETWDFIQFDTIVDTESELYGHLILQW